MSTSSSYLARICSRCGTRADARRGQSPMCLSCGQPFPVAVVGAYGAVPTLKTSSPLAWLVAILAVFFLMAMGATLVLFSRPPARAAAPSTRPTANEEVDPPAPAPPIIPSAPPSASSVKSAAPLTDGERDELAGSYTCSMDDSPSFPCRIAGGALEKLGGSQRFKGPVAKLSGGDIAFTGTFFCPFGDCTHPVATTFVRQGPGRYVGKFGINTIPGGGPGGERVVLTKVR